jgi:phage terminase small subunit
MGRTKNAASNGSGRPSEKEQIDLRSGNEPPQLPPDMTGPHAIEMWKLAVESLPHVLRKVDGPVLRLCCESYQLAMDSLALLAVDQQNEKASRTYISAVTKFDALANRIGLNPSSRRIVKPAKGEATGEGEFDEWLKRGNLN